MNNRFPIAIFPSQLTSFKKQARDLASVISAVVPKVHLSAFQQHDYLAIAFGYEKYNNMKASIKFRSTADRRQPPLEITDASIWDKVVEVFVIKVSGLEVHHMHQVKNLLLNEVTCAYTDQTIYPTSIKDRAAELWHDLIVEIIPPHSKPSHFLYWHDHIVPREY